MSYEVNVPTNCMAEAAKFADKELSKLCSIWTSDIWNEMDWDRIKELQVRDILEQRETQAGIAQSRRCLDCSNFLKHVSELRPLEDLRLCLRP